MINSRSLEDLIPEVKVKAKALIEAAAKEGIALTVTSTYRDFAKQAELYSQGRVNKTLPVVTNSKAGESWHNWRRAFDVVPVKNGTAIWNDNGLWKRIGILGELQGLTWGGNFKNFPDRPHFQYTEGQNVKDLLAKYPNGLP